MFMKLFVVATLVGFFSGCVAFGLAFSAGGLVSAGLNPGNTAPAAAGKISPGAQKALDRIRNPNAFGLGN